SCTGKPGKEGQYAEFLRRIAVPGDPACLFVFDGKPVITTWGFVPEGPRDPATAIFVGWDELTGRLPRVPTSAAPTPPPRAAGQKPAPKPEGGSNWWKWLLLALVLVGIWLAWRYWPVQPTVVLPPEPDEEPITDVASEPASLTAGIDPGARGNVSFTLVWTHAGSSRPGGPDIDLQVSDPKGNLLSSSNIGCKLGPTPEGGRIDRDDRGGWGRTPTPGGGPERAYWPDDQAPLGTYTYGVCYFKGDGEVDYTLRVYDRERLVAEQRGHLSPAEEGILREIGQVVLGGGAVTSVTGTGGETASATGGATSVTTGQTGTAVTGGDSSSHSSSWQSSTTGQTGTPGGTSSWVSSHSSIQVIDRPPAQHTFSHVSSSTWIDSGGGQQVVRLASEAYTHDEETPTVTTGDTASDATTVTTGGGEPAQPSNEKRFSLIMDSVGSFLDQALESDPPHPETTWDLQDPQGQTFVSDKAFFKDAPEKVRATGAHTVLRLIGPPLDKPYEVKVACTSPAGTRVFVFAVTTRKGE
ncbi:MAG: hypothetical protein GX442_20890, partial [Candidatus Riflebacteria bacterium]|nr:hypothetical protein [Candidatus Riflebacteria bacterium]